MEGGVSVVIEDTLGMQQTHIMMEATKAPREEEMRNVTTNVTPTAVGVPMEDKTEKKNPVINNAQVSILLMTN